MKKQAEAFLLPIGERMKIHNNKYIGPAGSLIKPKQTILPPGKREGARIDALSLTFRCENNHQIDLGPQLPPDSRSGR